MLTKNIDLSGKRILITGAAGFIGANLVTALLKRYDNIGIVGVTIPEPTSGLLLLLGGAMLALRRRRA